MLTPFRSKPRRRLAVLGLVLGLLPAAVTACAHGGTRPNDILADDHVSDAEYRSAVTAAQKCVVEAGWETSSVTERPDGVLLVFSVEGTAEQAGMDPTQDLSDCLAEHVDAVEQKYIEQHMLTGAEKEAELDRMFECFQEIPVDGVTRSDGSKELIGKTWEQYGMDSDEAWAANMCIEAHKWAVTDQTE